MKKSYLGSKESGTLTIKESDFDQLIERTKRYEKALQQVANFGSQESTAKFLQEVAEKALRNIE